MAAPTGRAEASRARGRAGREAGGDARACSVHIVLARTVQRRRRELLKMPWIVLVDSSAISPKKSPMVSVPTSISTGSLLPASPDEVLQAAVACDLGFCKT